ncbi:FG-GAP-like repeat-containing protein [Tundrisphaera lichenicola]|uniref:FG-GAP-like repeat-containing protein n=1 Tax=Tundrisphaera lichenicola TaxID=2029860 RepID=UPI003EBCAAE3
MTTSSTDDPGSVPAQDLGRGRVVGWRPSTISLAVLAILLGSGCAYWFYRGWRASNLLESARGAVARGERASAARDYAKVLEWWPRDDEAAYGLGACEQAAGHLDAAAEAWGRIGSDSPYANLAAVKIAPIELERGRFARAEDLLEPVVRAGGKPSIEAREILGRVLRFEDRRDEARELLGQELLQAQDPVPVLRSLWMLDFEAVAIDRTRSMFEKAAREQPDDDRVRLGLANLDRRSGKLDEVAAGLRACLVSRPEDHAAWRSLLEWALAAGRVEEVHRALPHLAANRFYEPEILNLRAWLAARSGDRRAERRELERLVDRDPAYPGALERLATIEALDGETEKVAALRRRKAELDRALHRYHEIFEMGADQLPGHALEMARLAESLGRPIEAWGWWTLQLRNQPGDQEARSALDRLGKIGPIAPPGTSLAVRVLDLGPSPLASTTAPAPGPSGVPPSFTEDAERVGLRFAFDQDPTPECRLPETMSGGVAMIDHDRDGWLDIYCIQGGPLDPTSGRKSPGDRLFRNRGDGTFEDASQSSGITEMSRGYGHGVAVGDFDSDGWPDLFLTRFGSYALYRNKGDGTFEDATDRAGLGGDRGWPTSAAFADLDGDGDLDLYVCHYVKWDRDHPARCHDPETNRPTYCEPRAFEAEPDRLFRNDGGLFVDVTDEAGIVDKDGRGLGVVANDLDGDGRVDLFVANDTTANFAFFNEGGLKFREMGLEAGLAGNAEGSYLAGMGVACGDPNGDGRPDLAVTNFYNESTTLYRNLGPRMFADEGASSGTTLPSRYLLGFGIAFLDFNNDGRLDLATANGHVNDSRPLYPYAMPMLLLAGGDSGRFVDVTAEVGTPMTAPRIGRGLATGDLDNDGKVDLLVVDQGSPLVYLHNATRGGHFLTLRLEGTRSGREAVGAKVIVTGGGRRQSAWRFGGGSYLTAGDSRLYFGLGDPGEVESVEVSWPSGHVDRFQGLRGDTGYLLREGGSEPEPLPGFAGPPDRPNPDQPVLRP